jgi:hypothetical protein
MYWTRWCRWFATSQLLRASHSFSVREQLKQQGAKSVNGPSFVCSLYSLPSTHSEIPQLGRKINQNLKKSQNDLKMSSNGPKRLEIF